MKKVLHIIKKIEGLFLILMLALIVLVTFLQVVGRYTPFPFSSKFEEIAVYTFVWMTLFGSAACIHSGLHMKMDFFISRLSETQKAYAVLWHHVVSLVFSAGLAYIAYRLIPIIKRAEMVSASLQWPIWVFKLAVPIGFALMSFWSIVRIVESIHAISLQKPK
jgi:C4-dicarboxylate transporter DctQ subunit